MAPSGAALSLQTILQYSHLRLCRVRASLINRLSNSSPLRADKADCVSARMKVTFVLERGIFIVAMGMAHARREAAAVRGALAAALIYAAQ
eukprot:4821385-Pleurochrysis_carterae.AAC.5